MCLFWRRRVLVSVRFWSARPYPRVKARVSIEASVRRGVFLYNDMINKSPDSIPA